MAFPATSALESLANHKKDEAEGGETANFIDLHSKPTIACFELSKAARIKQRPEGSGGLGVWFQVGGWNPGDLGHIAIGHVIPRSRSSP